MGPNLWYPCGLGRGGTGTRLRCCVAPPSRRNAARGHLAIGRRRKDLKNHAVVVALIAGGLAGAPARAVYVSIEANLADEYPDTSYSGAC